MKNITKKCRYKFYLEGKEGVQTLAVDIFYKKKQIGRFNWCGGISHDKKFAVRYNEVYYAA